MDDDRRSLFRIATIHILLGLCLFGMGCVYNDRCYAFLSFVNPACLGDLNGKR